MATSFEVGSVFRIVDEVTPQLDRMGRRVTQFGELVAKVKTDLKTIGETKFTQLEGAMKALGDRVAIVSAQIAESSEKIDASATNAIGGVSALANAWRQVGAAASAASRASRAAGTTAAAAYGGGLAGGGGGGGVPAGIRARGSRSGLHIRSRFGVGPAHFGGGGAGMAAGFGAGFAGYEGIDQEVVAQRYANQAALSGFDVHDLAGRLKRKEQFEELIKRSSAETGRSYRDVGEAALSIERQLQTKGVGWDEIMGMEPALLRNAWMESQLKEGTTLNEAAKAQVGIAHMLQQYDPGHIEEIGKNVGLLSMLNPQSLPQMEASLSYSLPLLKQTGIDPWQVAAMQTVMSGAGITRTKSGTWLTDMLIRSMPGNKDFDSEKKLLKKDSQLYKLGLVDQQFNPTWYTDGKPDAQKYLEKLREGLLKLPEQERATALMSVLGSQGGKAAGVLSEDLVQGRVGFVLENLKNAVGSQEALEYFAKNDPMMQFQQNWQKLINVLTDFGKDVLPPLVSSMTAFVAGMEKLDQVLGSGVFGTIVSGAIGAGAGAIVGGPVGAAIGGVGGLIFGGAGALMGGKGVKTVPITPGGTPAPSTTPGYGYFDPTSYTGGARYQNGLYTGENNGRYGSDSLKKLIEEGTRDGVIDAFRYLQDTGDQSGGGGGGFTNAMYTGGGGGASGFGAGGGGAGAYVGGGNFRGGGVANPGTGAGSADRVPNAGAYPMTPYGGVGGFNFMGSARARAMGMDVHPGDMRDMVHRQTAVGSITANKYAADDIAGFVNDLHAAGAPLNNYSGVYANRHKRGGGGWSQHAYGNAIDIETGFGHGPDNSPYLYKWSQAHPKEFADILAKHHMKNGASFGDWGHFEWTPTAHTAGTAGTDIQKSQPLGYQVWKWKDNLRGHEHAGPGMPHWGTGDIDYAIHGGGSHVEPHQSGGHEVHIHNAMHLDGRQFAKNSAKHMVKMGNGRMSGARLADYAGTRPAEV